MKVKKFGLSTTFVIMISFLAAILVGSLLLSLPQCSADGRGVSYIDALFTATTATCVTGLVTVNTAATWSTLGHVIILVLIQIGGLGIITVMSGIMLMWGKRMGLGDRILLRDVFNLNTMSGMSEFIKKVLIGTGIVELAGAIMYMPVFVRDFGARGIWISVFNSVSSFCNAGIDIIGENSLMDYAHDPLVNGVTCALIAIGGIGYVVWWDVIDNVRIAIKNKRRVFRYLTLHSKIALTTTVILIIGGAILIFLCEYDNINTIGNMSLYDKIQVSVFQSVTTRTAGFMTIPQSSLTNGSSIVSLLLMFIGGSPVGTAGGVKTVTVAVLICSACATYKDKEKANMFDRSIANDAVRRAVAVVCAFTAIVLMSTFVLSVCTDADMLDIMFETVSATATVGLSRDLTPSLPNIGKFAIILSMYLGRVGPISLAVVFASKKENKNMISDPEEEISVG